MPITLTRIEDLRGSGMFDDHLLLTTSFDSAAIGMAVVGLDLKFLKINSKFSEITGYSQSELLQMTVADITHPEDIQKNIDEDEKAKNSGPESNSFCMRKRYIHKSGNIVWVHLTVSAIFVKDQTSADFFISQVIDITKQVQLELDLQKSIVTAENAVRTKSSFLANVSHEIRTPMNGIIGLTDILLEDSTDSKVTEKLRTIQECCNTLIDLVNDVLDFSKLEANKVNLENIPLNIEETSNQIIELLSPAIRKKGNNALVRIDSDCPKIILGDQVRIRQILTNLISNANKFTYSGDIEVSITKRPSKKKLLIQVEVSDSGVGIDEETCQKLFKSFSQADASTTRKFGGTGLGLSICKGLVELMGGEIWVNSEPGQGSAFVFYFETKQSDERKPIDQQEIQSDLDLKQLEILVAEDNHVNQMVIKGYLEKFGCSFHVVDNGQQAVEAFISGNYNLILMDCYMPVMDGFKASRQIRQINQKVPIFALTASTLKEDLVRCKESGMTKCLSKPIKKKRLLQELQRLLEDL